MPTTTFSLGGYQNVGEVSYDVQSIKGGGGAAYPLLTFPIEVAIRSAVSPPRDAPTLTPKTFRPVTLLHMTGALRLLDSTRVAEMAPQVLAHHSYTELGSKRTFYLDFPISAHCISVIEKKRLGGDLGFQLSLGILAAFHAESLAADQPSGPVGTFHAGELTLTFSIPQSQWAGAILPKLGHGEIVVMELPLPAPDKRKAMDGAIEHLNRAWAAYRQGNDPEVLRVCYLLWERLVRDFDAGEKPDQNAFSRLMEKIGIEEAKQESLRHICDYLARFNHLGRHEREPAVPVDHRDAEFALLTTQTILVYLAKLTT